MYLDSGNCSPLLRERVCFSFEFIIVKRFRD